jgi:flagellar hook-associated protein 1 FlgK
VIPNGAVQSGAGAHIGSGVDVLSYRRIRDTFLDLQYRAQATRLGNEAGKAEGLDRAELALAEPGETGINAKLSEFWSAWGDLSDNANDISARTALIEAADSLAESFSIVDGQLALVSQQAADEYTSFTAPGGEIERIGEEIASLNTTIKAFFTAGDTPNDLMDQRDLLLDRLSELGTTSIVTNADGSVDVTFGGATAPMIDSTGYHAEPLGATPGGRLGALKELSTVPGGLIDSYRTELGAVANNLATAVNALHPGFFSVTHAPPATYGGDTLAVAATTATLFPGSTTEASANEVARAVAELSGKGPDSAYNAFVARVGSEVRKAVGNEANAQALADAVQDRRESVAGVSLDEEMSQIIKFQRAYQASSRAMSTMDEMLDVLINRTGRVGL